MGSIYLVLRFPLNLHVQRANTSTYLVAGWHDYVAALNKSSEQANE